MISQWVWGAVFVVVGAVAINQARRSWVAADRHLAELKDLADRADLSDIAPGQAVSLDELRARAMKG